MRFVLLLALGVLAACATATGPDAAKRFDRFEAEASDFRRFDAVYVAPVEIGEAVRARLEVSGVNSLRRDERALGQRDLDRNSAALRDALRREFSQTARLVDAPGAGVLTVAVTLTDLDANRPTLAEQRANPSLSFQSLSVGGAAVTGELRENGLVLARFEDASMQARITDPAIGAGLWVEADRYYRQLADKLAGLLR